MEDIILASASPRRAELLKQIGIEFKTLPSNMDEKVDEGVAPEKVAEKLAYDKALGVAEAVGSAYIVIGADTIVVKDGILGKPLDEKNAFHMLNSLQGEWHEVITGVSVIHSGSKECVKEYEKTRVKMRALSESEIWNYIKTGEPMDKAGAYGIQGMGALLVEKIEGCYFNVVGLPIGKLSQMLKTFGVKLL